VIILSGVLVVLAIALLVTGIVTGNTGHEVAGLDGLKLIYVSIGVSIISALCLAIGVFLRRKELFGSTESLTSTRRSAASRSGKATRPAKAKARVGAGDDTVSTPMPSATATDVPAETSVYVVPGRKRYHLETCRQLAGRDKEELTFVEAREEGFTACTACLPDTALAARAASTDTATLESPVTEPATTEDRTETADLTRREDDDPAQVTRTDLPITRLEDDDLAPAAESPAAAEPSSPPAETSTYGTGTDAPADTTRFDEPAETPEVAPEPPVERPLARSRSLFEPLDHEEPAATAEPEPEPEPQSEPEPEPYEPEDAEPAAREPEEPDTEPEAPSDETETEAEDEADEADEAAATETDRESTEPEPVAEAPATDTEAATADEPDDEPSADEAADREESDHDDAETGEAASEDAPDEDTSKDAEPAEDATGDPSLPYVRILSGTKRYHRPDCALIEDIADDADDLETVPPSEAKERGCTPCLVCQPDKDPSDEGY
jgi:hypothetical protein